MKAIETDVCVVGGGPAGSTLAAQLAALDHRVVLVERAEFPRRHLGESLTPGVRPLLESIGVGDVFEKTGALAVESVLVNWDGELRERADPDANGMLVDRGRFDALLVKHVRAAGVQVLQPATFRDCVSSAEGWRITVKRGGETILIRARFLADASGRAYATRGRKRRTGARTIALYAYWQGSGLPKRPRIEAVADAWYWGVPIPGGTYNTLIFVDPRTYAPERFQELVAQSGLLEGCRDICLVSPVQAADATPYIDEESVTRSQHQGWRCGAFDRSAVVERSAEGDPDRALRLGSGEHTFAKAGISDAAIEFYRSSLADASERHSNWAAEYYSAAAATRSAEFWRQRASVSTPRRARSSFSADDFADEPLTLSLDLTLWNCPVLKASM